MRTRDRLLRSAVLAALAVGILPGTGTAVSSATCFGEPATVPGGTAAADYLLGTPGDDVIIGLGGDDTIIGDGGNDKICGGDGFDHIRPDAGNDRMDGGPGGNAVYYDTSPSPVTVDFGAGTAIGDGNDTIENIDNGWGSPFGDVIRGNGASNLLFGDAGDDDVRGVAGPDLLLGQDGDDSLKGGFGFDYASFAYSVNPVTVNLAAGTAVGEGSDTLATIEGVIGSTGGDQLFGKSGTQAFVGDPDQDPGGTYGDDTIDGRGGLDMTFYMFAPGPIHAYLDVSVTSPDWPSAAPPHPAALGGYVSGGEGTDFLASSEIVVGTDFDDILEGDSRANGLFGGRGNDTLYGLGKADYLDGEQGIDTGDGGSGRDRCLTENKTACEKRSGAADLDDEVSDAARAFRKH